MAEMPKKHTYLVDFKMATPEGSAPVRVAAGHAIRVGEAWAELGTRMMAMADAFDHCTRLERDEDGTATATPLSDEETQS